MLSTVFDFLLGPPTPAIATMLLVSGLNVILGLLTAEDKLAALRQEWKRPIAYLLFYIAGHRLDALLIDSLFGWHGSTKLLVVLGLMAKDGRQLLTRISVWSGVSAPTALDGRLDQMERGDTNRQSVDGRVLDQEIENLRRNMEKLKELNRLKKEMGDLSDPDGGLGPI